MNYRFYLLFGYFLLFLTTLNEQLQPLSGKISASGDVEGIHVLNKTALKYTVSDENGRFNILVKANDTLVFSALRYKIKEVAITKTNLTEGYLKVYLVDKVNELDEVVVGKVLTGNLGSDIKNTEVETPINFYDLGIPGYTGKPKTVNERKLAEATSGGGLIPLNPILNLLTGRTKMLKQRIALDRKIRCVDKLKDNYKEMIFEESKYSEEFQNKFFSYILDSEELESACNASNKLAPINFIFEELDKFKALQTDAIKD